MCGMCVSCIEEICTLCIISWFMMSFRISLVVKKSGLRDAMFSVLVPGCWFIVADLFCCIVVFCSFLYNFCCYCSFVLQEDKFCAILGVFVEGADISVCTFALVVVR